MAGWRGLTAPTPRGPPQTVAQAKLSVAAAKELLKGNPDGLREVVRAVLQEVLEAEMTDALGAAKGERTGGAPGYPPGHYSRTLGTRGGALVATLAEMYVQGVSTREVKAVTEELCGHASAAGRCRSRSGSTATAAAR